MNMQNKKMDERGVVSVFVSIMFIAILAVLGLIQDGAAINNSRRQLGNTAAQAARAGAQEIDTDTLRDKGIIVLDSVEARAVARAVLARENTLGSVDVQSNQVSVTAQKPVRLLGGRTFTVNARHTARVVTQ